MSAKTQLRRIKRDPQAGNGDDVEIVNHCGDKNSGLSEKDLEEIASKIGNRVNKRLKDTELGQREILKLTETYPQK